MIEIKTYLDGNGCDDAKIPYEEYFGALCNERDGAIEFIIDGKLLFRHQGEYINIEWTSILYTILMFLSKEGKTIKDAPLVESEACIHLEPMGCEMLHKKGVRSCLLPFIDANLSSLWQDPSD